MAAKKDPIGKAIAIVGAAAGAGLAVVKLADLTADFFEKRKEKRGKMIPVPNLVGVNITTAQECIRDLDLLYASKPIKPSIKYKDEEAETVVKMSHKPGVKVYPKTTLITLDYITQDIIVESNKLFLEREYKKEQAKENRQKKLEDAQNRVRKVVNIKKNEDSSQS